MKAFMIRMLAAFTLLACAPCLAQSPDIAVLLKSNGVPSVSFAVIQNHRIVRTEALGEQSPGIRATPAMLYNIASLTKPLTAEILLRMASAGAFGLDDKMSPAFVDPDVADDPRSRLLTPRLADRYLLQPDHLQNTAFVGQPWFDGRIAVPTDANGNALKPNIAKHFIAADLVYTTAGDYARFMLSVLKDEGLTREIATDRTRVQLSQKESDCQGSKAASCPMDVGPVLAGRS